ncbi:nitroreductase family deazaflavin-dependent oxidoreductase [Cryobacterium sp. 1639]|uniref:nitroreductase family deazaflavin-dependent oxidoreductase n=1 Tax=Cryobacterium inferilacus TaxID=2866629 RepID=UPI001C7385D1|nr:nitroreductase family deazaflavin-dependent oxidoreductase [Cryobacterium sp. 1639]MBX0300364.1 nitroreductase family deazaflavin-dependent oxidoreductase [Cryobacterium sp. 1639]
MSAVLSLVRSAVAPLTRTRLFRATAPALLPPAERFLERISRGRLQLSALLVPSLVLRSTGARSGLPRETRLMYTPDGDGRAIVAGTSFARARHPAWTYNLMTHPDAEIVVRGRRLSVRASLIGPAGRDAAWDRIECQWPGYRGYERDSGRVVRMFLLRPVAERGTLSVPWVGTGPTV